MNTKSDKYECKRGGKRPYFTLKICEEIARKYFDEDRSAGELANLYKEFSPNGKLSASAIRAMARRGRAHTLLSRFEAEESRGHVIDLDTLD